MNATDPSRPDAPGPTTAPALPTGTALSPSRPADPDDPSGWSAVQALAAMADGRLTSERLVRACLGRIDADEARVRAWVRVDADGALAQARAADRARRDGLAGGALHGLPVGLKDIVDTADLPTENGTPLHAGRRPSEDAVLVARLRAAGAVVLGKTVTTELATYAPGPTRNPHDPAHTPGGSSSGSAAAVAAGMVPLAVGTQTNGSVIRPAAFCGVFGYKPSFGWVPRHGVLVQSPPLDQPGLFARTVEDLALAAGPLIGPDPRDPDTADAPSAPALLDAVRGPLPRPPRLVMARTPNWGDAEASTRQALEGLARRLAPRPETVDLPSWLAEAWTWHATVMEADIAAHFGALHDRDAARLSASLRGQIDRGRRITPAARAAALRQRDAVRTALDAVLDRGDALLTAAAPGAAPRGLDSTGSPAFCTLWTFAGLPAVSLPLLRSPGGLPLGVQLVGRHGDDAALLRTARWLADAAVPPPADT